MYILCRLETACPMRAQGGDWKAVAVLGTHRILLVAQEQQPLLKILVFQTFSGSSHYQAYVLSKCRFGRPPRGILKAY